MKGLFNYDGAVTVFLMKLGDCVLLSVLWVLFSLPVFTMGAATTALYHAVRKVLREDYTGIFSHFWEGFRDNFKQSTAIGLILMLIFGILGASTYSAWLLYEAGEMGKLFFILLLIICALVLMWAVYLLPCVDRFQSTVKRILQSCVQVALLNLIWSVVLMIICCGTVYLMLQLPMALAILPAAGMYASSFLLEYVFRKYMNAEEPTGEMEQAE